MKNNEVCTSCGEVLRGKYCHNCGDKKFDKSEFTVMNFVGQIFYNLTHFESKFWKSLYVLCLKPGFITSEYLIGRRINYLKPFQFFLLMNIVYFFVLYYYGYDVFTASPEDYMEKDLFGSFYTSMINEKVESGNLSLSDYTENFYNHIYLHSKLLIILLIPMLAMSLKLLYFKSERLYFEHLIYSTHLMTFLLFFFTVILNLLSFLLFYILKYIFRYENDFIIQNEFGIIVAAFCTFFYVFFSLKEVYGQTGIVTFMKSVLFILSLIIVTEIFRVILFFTVYFFA